MTSRVAVTREPLRYLTEAMPGIGGVIKQFDEDFVVEEMPQYPASGSGTHVYLTIEKRGLPTLTAVRLIAKALRKKSSDIGYAGLKDAHGITRQRISVEHLDDESLRGLAALALTAIDPRDSARADGRAADSHENALLPYWPDRIRVLAVERHTNKIKLGHLSGNRFEIKIRHTSAAGAGNQSAARDEETQRALTVIEVLARRGVPNYFGPQRFGARGDNAEIGVAVLEGNFGEALAIMLGRPNEFDREPVRRARALFDAGDFKAAATAWPAKLAAQAKAARAFAVAPHDARRAWRTVDHALRRLYVSSVQSELFNRVLAVRIDNSDRVEVGDVAWKHANGACFLVENETTEQPRCSAFEISPTGPLFGKKMKQASAQQADLEARILGASGLGPEVFRAKDGVKLDGARRPLRVPLSHPRVDAGKDERGPFLRLRFALPPGAYATNVTREVCKTETRTDPATP